MPAEPSADIYRPLRAPEQTPSDEICSCPSGTRVGEADSVVLVAPSPPAGPTRAAWTGYAARTARKGSPRRRKTSTTRGSNWVPAASRRRRRASSVGRRLR